MIRNIAFKGKKFGDSKVQNVYLNIKRTNIFYLSVRNIFLEERVTLININRTGIF